MVIGCTKNPAGGGSAGFAEELGRCLGASRRKHEPVSGRVLAATPVLGGSRGRKHPSPAWTQF